MLDSDDRERFRDACGHLQDWKQQVRDEMLCDVHAWLEETMAAWRERKSAAEKYESMEEPGACVEEPPNCGE